MSIRNWIINKLLNIVHKTETQKPILLLKMVTLIKKDQLVIPKDFQRDEIWSKDQRNEICLKE